MKVGICVLRVADLQGGNTESIYSLARELQKKGIKIEFLLPKIKTKIPFKARYFGDSKTFYNPFEPKFPVLLLKFIKEVEIFSKEVDLLQISLPTPALAFLGDLIKANSGKTVVVSFDSILYKEILLPGDSKDFSLFLRSIVNSSFFARISRFNCDYYIVSSKYQKESLADLGCPRKKIKIIPNAFNKEKLDECNKTSGKIKRLPRKGRFVSYVGHFNWHKGADVFVKAMPMVLKTNPDVKFVLAWSTRGKKRHIMKLIDEFDLGKNVLVLKRIDVGHLFDRTDVLVLPYRVGFGTQSFPNTILEAFYMGTPLVSTKVNPTKELFLNGKNALMVAPEKPGKLASAILKILENKELAEGMCRSQRKFIRKDFLPEIIAKRYIKEVYEAT